MAPTWKRLHYHCTDDIGIKLESQSFQLTKWLSSDIRINSYNAGILTELPNRIGDVALLIVNAWILNFGRWNYIYYLDCM